MASVVNINGKTILLPDGGGPVSIRNGVLYVNGKKWEEQGNKTDASGIMKIVITGDLLSLTCDRAVELTGGVGGDVHAVGNVVVHCDVNGNVDANGTVECKNVGGNVHSNGAVRCGDVTGNVDSNGRVECGNVGGSIDANGPVTHRK
jgi:cytoskeletal protein CcmA (bactofilin family)